MRKLKWVKRGILMVGVLALFPLSWLGVRAARPKPTPQFPAQVFGSGAITVELEVECMSECLLGAEFIGAGPDQKLEVAERLSPGNHLRVVRMPPGVGGKVDLLGLSPKPEDQMKLRIRSNKDAMYDGTSTIHRGLWSGAAHGVVCEDMPLGSRPQTPACWAIQTQFDDFSKPRRRDTQSPN